MIDVELMNGWRVQGDFDTAHAMTVVDQNGDAVNGVRRVTLDHLWEDAPVVRIEMLPMLKGQTHP